MKYLFLAISLLLAGCAANKYTDTCDLKQPDPQGTGYTKAQFPCSLKHYEGKKP
jgi:hypothetical protein